MTHVVGIDTSTTATKAVFMDPRGGLTAVGTAAYDYAIPRPGWSEQDPALWWDAAVTAIRSGLEASGLDPADIDAVGLTGQMHGSVLLDGNGEVIRPALLWNDQRTSAECEEIRDRVGRERLIRTTGNDALTGFTSPKLLWVRNHEPDQWQKVATVLLPKDYLRFRLTGTLATDVADGSGTGLFGLSDRTWSTEILEALDLPQPLFPQTFEGPTVTGTISEEGAGATGLLSGTPVIAGGGDQAANAVGVGATEAGVIAVSLGTSGVVFATSDGPAVEEDARVHAFCHALPGRWHMMGVMLSAAGSLRWLRDALAPTASFDELTLGASQVPAGSEGLLFLPYLSGERTPHPDPKARGAFVGLTTGHDIRHMTRAVLEGVAFGLRDGLELMVSAGVPRPETIRASGGGTTSPLWRQILADVLGARIDTTITEEGAAFGAGVLATVGAGHHPTVDAAVSEMVAVRPEQTPSHDAGLYDRIHHRYQELYPALKATFHNP